MKEHYVVRTFKANGLSTGTEKLEDFLEDGWIVVFVTPFDDFIEYIIKREN